MSYKSKQKETGKQRYVENRKNLIDLSKLARSLIEMGEADSVNDGLIYLYDQRQQKACEYNTFNQWKEKGYTIIKGVHAFCVWGQPRTASQTPEGATEPEEYKYWPICYLFSELQVINSEKLREGIDAETFAAVTEPEPAEVLEMDTILN
jgi:hypothetical protein